MSQTWLAFCTRRPGPARKQGYPGVAGRTLSQIEGEVKHSMEGYLAGALGVLDNLSRQASWHFSIPKSGPPLQHFPLEAIAWHAGLPGDRRVDTSLIGNLTLVGEEHEDYPDNRLNENQIHWSTRISKAVRQVSPHVAAAPPTLRVNLWEHRWLSATSCPSGLIPWAEIIQRVTEEEEAMLLAVQHSTKGIYVLDGPYKVHVGPAWWGALRALGYKNAGLSDAQIDGLPERPLGGGTGPSTAQVAATVRKELDKTKLGS